MATQSFLSDADVAELTKRAVAGRQARQVKAAFGADEVKALFSRIRANKPLSHGLVGAGVGAVGGGLLNMAKPREKRTPLASMATGALAGGGLGAGVGMLRSQPNIDRLQDFAGGVKDRVMDTWRGLTDTEAPAPEPKPSGPDLTNVPTGELMQQLEEAENAMPGTWGQASRWALKENIPEAGAAAALATGVHQLDTFPTFLALDRGLSDANATQKLNPAAVSEMQQMPWWRQQFLAMKGRYGSGKVHTSKAAPAASNYLNVPTTPPVSRPTVNAGQVRGLLSAGAKQHGALRRAAPPVAQVTILGALAGKLGLDIYQLNKAINSYRHLLDLAAEGKTTVEGLRGDTSLADDFANVARLNPRMRASLGGPPTPPVAVEWNALDAMNR
jgi:hypothetical protein